MLIFAFSALAVSSSCADIDCVIYDAAKISANYETSNFFKAQLVKDETPTVDYRKFVGGKDSDGNLIT